MLELEARTFKFHDDSKFLELNLHKSSIDH
jgi:hypothetical protein